MRLIDADALANVIETNCPALNFAALLSKGWVLSLIRDKTNTPTVELKRGKWIAAWFDSRPVCSECGKFADERTDYCPNCGAKMDGGDEDAGDD